MVVVEHWLAAYSADARSHCQHPCTLSGRVAELLPPDAARIVGVACFVCICVCVRVCVRVRVCVCMCVRVC